ncbi:MAG: carbohydrate ABC transporter permease [Betaproteobacteria bacterium]
MRRTLWKRILFYALVIAVTGILAFPFYWMIVEAIQAGTVFRYPPLLWPDGVTLRSFVKVIQERPVLQWFQNTLLVALFTVFLTLVGSVTAGYSLSRFKTRINQVAGVAILTTQMLPATLLVIPIFVIFRQLALLDNLFGLVLSNTAFSLPLGIWMMKGFFDSIPKEIDEAGRIDGCNTAQLILKLVLPLSWPGLVTVAVSAFLLAWDEFFMARTLISSQSKWVLSVGLSSFVGEYSIQWDQMLATATMFCLPPVVFFIFVQRYLLHGLTGGAVKG